MTMRESEKWQAWVAVEKRLTKITDRLGMPIDAGIMEVCIGLNANGVNTTFSCEGHIDRKMNIWVCHKSLPYYELQTTDYQ